MRLIDADALKGKTEAHGAKIAYVVSFLWDIDDAPTIDAIPVKWLVNLKAEYAREGREQAEGDLMNLLLMWKKEQEAKK